MRKKKYIPFCRPAMVKAMFKNSV